LHSYKKLAPFYFSVEFFHVRKIERDIVLKPLRNRGTQERLRRFFSKVEFRDLNREKHEGLRHKKTK